MRVAFITFEYPPSNMGGAGTYAFNITKELAKLGHDFYIFTPSFDDVNDGSNKELNVTIIKVKINKRLPFKALQFWLRLPHILKMTDNYINFDLIHLNGISYGFIKKRLIRKPLIITIHHLVKDTISCLNVSFISRIFHVGDEYGLIIPWSERRGIKYVDKIIAVSEFTKNGILEVYKVPLEKVESIYNGIDSLELDYSAEQLDGIKSLLNLPDKPIILFVGRIDDPRKGLDQMLKILKKVIMTTDAVLLVVGDGNQERAKKVAHALGISNSVFFLGFVEKSTLKMCYSICDIYASSSKLEGFGLTIIEAMAAGKPILAKRVGAIPEIVKNMENGIIVEPNDFDGFVNGIITLITNRELRNSIGSKNIKYIEETFSWQKSAKETQRVYMELKR